MKHGRTSFVPFHRWAPQSGILFLVSIGRRTSRRVYHHRPWLSDMSWIGNAHCRLLACSGPGARRCVERRAQGESEMIRWAAQLQQEVIRVSRSRRCDHGRSLAA